MQIYSNFNTHCQQSKLHFYKKYYGVLFIFLVNTILYLSYLLEKNIKL